MVNLELSFKDNDDLDRASLADNIQQYVSILEKSIDDSSISIGINSKWGTGKTYFLNMWKKKLEDDHQKVVMYDAWANDDCGSALLPFLYSIISIREDIVSATSKEYLKKFLKILVCETSKFGARKIFGADTDISKIIEGGFDGIQSIDEEKIKTIFKDFDDYYGNRQTLEDTLKQLVRDSCTDGHLWVFIDDLDRCEPKFAISTLECIKHFFNIKKIVYIFAIDMEQLQFIASNVYGKQIDTYSYLQRFFDCIYDLPDPNIEKYIRCKIDKMNIDASVRDIINIEEICNFVKHFQCSLRDLNLVTLHLELFLRNNASKILNMPREKQPESFRVYIFFIVIKAKFPIQYNRIIHGDFSIGKESTLHEQLVLGEYFTKVNNTTNNLMEELKDGQATLRYEYIVKRYSLIPSSAKSFEEHMQGLII